MKENQFLSLKIGGWYIFYRISIQMFLNHSPKEILNGIFWGLIFGPIQSSLSLKIGRFALLSSPPPLETLVRSSISTNWPYLVSKVSHLRGQANERMWPGLTTVCFIFKCSFFRGREEESSSLFPCWLSLTDIVLVYIPIILFSFCRSQP